MCWAILSPLLQQITKKLSNRIIKKLITPSRTHQLMSWHHSNDKRIIGKWQWDRSVSTRRAAPPPRPKENAGACRGWTRIHPMTRDTCMGQPGSCPTTRTRRQQQASRTISPATSPFPSLSSTSRTERASRRLPARKFGMAGQRILGDSCKLGTFIIHTLSKGDEY